MVDKFDYLLNEALDEIGSDPDKVSSALNTLDEIEVAENYVKELKERLETQREDLCAGVAAELKKLLPKMEVRLSGGGCTFSYRARSLSIKPDFKNKVWLLEAGPTSRDKSLANKLSDMSDTPLIDWRLLITQIAEVFVGRYKTLQGGNVELPEKPEITDDAIDLELGKLSAADSPAPPAGPAIQKRGVSKSAGSVDYA
jgi:hypothetical protein